MKSFKGGSENYIHLVIIVLLVVIIAMLMMYGSKKGGYEHFGPKDAALKAYNFCVNNCHTKGSSCAYNSKYYSVLNPDGKTFHKETNTSPKSIGGTGTMDAALACKDCVIACGKPPA